MAGLRDAGYTRGSLHKRCPIAVSFVEWARRRQLRLKDCDESSVTAFLGRASAQRLTKEQAALERSTVRRFLRHLRGEIGLDAARPWLQIRWASELERRYQDYLRHERGLSERSICAYTPFVRDLLTWHHPASEVRRSGIPEASTVRDFLLKRTQGRSPAYVHLLTAALRSFLRFLFRDGETQTDLSRAVPVVRTWRKAALHSHMSPQEIERILSAPDPSVRCRRRDHAVLLLLVRLGLRAGEVVGLNLEDILWRTGEIVVHGKGRTVDRLPLLSDVGAALVRYIRTDRRDSRSRRVFVRVSAPRVGFVGPAAIDGIVRKAFARAGVQRPGRGAAHLFRHSLATRMIRHGASIAEISEILRHRSLEATQIYAKLAFEDLRTVSQPWPRKRGLR